MDFSEDFLHFIWRFRLFNRLTLICATGEELSVLDPGMLNIHAGPDFSRARLRIDGTIWVGDVEIHLRSSDWWLHGHDHAYDTVILHVVYQYDQPIFRTDGSLIPVLVLKDLFAEHLLHNYHDLLNSINRFPCEKQLCHVDEVITTGFLSRVIVERLEQKSTAILRKLEDYKGDWNQTFYHFTARNFGFKINALPFELLADALPNAILLRHKDNALQIAALLFGQAGLLTNSFIEHYPMQLQQEYCFLQKKYGLMPIDPVCWKFLRMRPQNFPTIRLAQFAALMVEANHLLSSILEIEKLQDCYLLFEKLPVDGYWQTHYHFNKKTTKVTVQPGRQSIQNIITNTVCVFLYAYGKYTDRPEFVARALDFLEKLPPEKNAITAQYVSSGLKISSALMSQAVLQLNKCYCTQKKCLNCGIGIKILKK